MKISRRNLAGDSCTAIVLFILLATASWAGAAKETVLYSFQNTPDGSNPAGRVATDKSGNLYGTTWYGGTLANGCGGYCGIVFELSPPSSQGGAWTENIIYNFQGVNVGDGDFPHGGLIWSEGGKLYGTTAYGGTGDCVLLGGKVGCGTVYELTPPATTGGAWTEAVIYSFQGGKDGYWPEGELVSDDKGNLYGGTFYGGGYGVCDGGIYPYCGTIFELSPPTTQGSVWTEKVLYSFKNGTDGANANGSLVLDSQGALFGTTMFGGSPGCLSSSGRGCGVAFQLTPPMHGEKSWTYTVIHSFSPNPPDGAAPYAGLIFDKSGNLYGTTYAGGDAWSGHAGTVFELSPPSVSGQPWTETTLCNFGEGRTGSNPYGGVVFDGDENLYGTASNLGNYLAGTVFQLKRPTENGSAWTLNILHAFERSPDAATPTGTLIWGKEGKLYGLTALGGTGNCIGGCGTVYEIAP
jgi:uncharacterized repeat protein (TIGR03803 family)